MKEREKRKERKRGFSKVVWKENIVVPMLSFIQMERVEVNN